MCNECDMVLTKQMIRDKIAHKGAISVLELSKTLFKDEMLSARHYNTVMAHILDLEREGVVRYNVESGQYETDLVLS